VNTVHFSKVEIRERLREDIGEEELEWLMKSLVALGQLQPIVLQQEDGKYILRAGERRLRAVERLAKENLAPKGHEVGHLSFSIIGHLPQHVQLMVEFDENEKRKDFTYVEKARFIRKFHEEMERQSIAAGGKWTAELTAASLRLSPASISHYLRIEEAIKTDPGVAKATTLSSAVKRMKVAEKLRARHVEVRDNAAEAYSRAADIAKMGDALDLIRAIPSNSVDLVNFDPPWGDDTGHKSNDNWEGFDDDTESSDRIINGLLPELCRVLRDDRFLIFWYRAWAYGDMVGRLSAAGFSLKFGRTPCIWFKPDKVSDQNRFPEKQLIDAYETFMIVRKGDPVLHEQGRPNVFCYNRVPVAALIHPTEKPIDLCEALIKLLTVPGELVLDPTAGSMAILHAALRQNRRALGFELNETSHQRGLTRLGEYLKTLHQVEILK